MARKNNVKSEHPSSILFDSRTGTVMAGPDSNDNIKEKVQAVREVVLGKSNNEIVLVLQYYDYNVEKAIQAYLEDGAKEALGEWHVPPAKPNKKKKNKKKAANASQTDNGPSTPTGGAAAASTSLSSSLSSQPSLASPQPLPQRVPAVSNGISSSGSSSITETNNSSSSSSSKPPVSNGMIYSGSIKDVEVSDMPVEDGAVTAAAAAETSTSSDHPSVSASKQHHRHLHAGSHGHGHGHAHGHNHNQRTRTTSERSTASSVGAGGDNHPKRPFQGLEKSIKDLQRQTTSLEHLRLMLDHEIERSCKSVKTVFEEMRTHLNTREKEIMTEMDLVKQQACEVFKMRQEKAASLKVHIERAEKLSEAELTDLRADVKHFVADRKIDEELGKTTRFQYDSDHLKEEILSFGEVLPVKHNYAVRRPSVSSVASSGPGAEDVPPSLHPDPVTVTSLPVATAQAQENAQMTTEELANLQIRLQNSLKLQGLAEGGKPRSNGSDNSAAIKDDGYQTKSARRRNRNRERQEQRKTEEETMVTSSPSGESTSRAATPSSTHASAGSASPSPQRGQRSSPQRGGGGYRGRGRGGSGGGGYRGGYQGRGSPRRPYSAGRGGGRGGGGDYYRPQGGSRPVVVNGGSS